MTGILHLDLYQEPTLCYSLSMRVFIADDAAFIREFMKSLFTSSGHQVVGEAEDGEGVLSQIGKVLPDLLVLDIVMPLLNGVDVLKILRPQYPQMKVLVCTTMGNDLNIDPSLYDGKLNKPFSNEEFKGFLKKFALSKGA